MTCCDICGALCNGLTICDDCHEHIQHMEDEVLSEDYGYYPEDFGLTEEL